MPSNTTDNIEDGEEDYSKYNNDGNALNRHSWKKYLAKRAYKHSKSFRTHVEFGYHMAGHRTITAKRRCH